MVRSSKDKKTQNNGPGRRPIPEDQRRTKLLKQRTVNMSDEMWQRLQNEASIRNMDAAELNRQVIEWFFTSLDTKRGDSEANKLFDA